VLIYLCRSVLSKGLLTDIVGKTKRIKESSGGNKTKLVLIGRSKKDTLGGNL
jgi:hypothetical protein